MQAERVPHPYLDFSTSNALLKKRLVGWQDGSGGKVPATKPGTLGSIPRAYMVEGENQLHKLSSGLPCYLILTNNQKETK